MKRTVGEKKWRPFEANQRHAWMVRCAASPSTAAFQGETTTWKNGGPSLHERRCIPATFAPAWLLLLKKKGAEL